MAKSWLARGFIGIALVVCVLAAPLEIAKAAEVAAPGTEPTPTGDGYLLPDYGDTSLLAPDTPWLGLSVDLFLKLALILALMYGCLWLLRRLTVGARGPLLKLGVVTVLEQTHLAQNRTLYLVELGDRLLLLGATPNQLTTLTEIHEPSEVAAVRAAFQKPAGTPFGAQLRAISEHLGRPRTDLASKRASFDDAATDTAVNTAIRSDAPAAEPDWSASEKATTEDSAAFLREKVAEIRRISQHFGR